MNFQGIENGIRGIQQGLCDGFYAQNTNTLTGFANTQNALATGFAGVQSALTGGFAGVDNAICTLGYQTQAGINSVNMANMQNTNAIQRDINAGTVANMQNTNAIQAQLAQCCCDNRAATKDLQYTMATDTCAIQNTIQNTTRDMIDTSNANTRSILDFLVQDKISTLQQENQTLRLAASQSAQNEYLVGQLKPCPIPAYLTCSPYQTYPGVGFNGFGGCGCGCNSGCGCN